MGGARCFGWAAREGGASGPFYLGLEKRAFRRMSPSLLHFSPPRAQEGAGRGSGASGREALGTPEGIFRLLRASRSARARALTQSSRAVVAGCGPDPRRALPGSPVGVSRGLFRQGAGRFLSIDSACLWALSFCAFVSPSLILSCWVLLSVSSCAAGPACKEGAERGALSRVVPTPGLDNLYRVFSRCAAPPLSLPVCRQLCRARSQHSAA